MSEKAADHILELPLGWRSNGRAACGRGWISQGLKPNER
jgi:hypothetical protein